MPLQQIFSPGINSTNRARKGLSGSNSTTPQLDKVYTQDEKDSAGENGPSLLKRCGSLTSSCSNSAEICRICHGEADIDAPLISPCHCTGSLRFVHQKCLQRWIKSSQAKTCELCKYEFCMESKTKPFNKWEKLDMSPVERRKILCSVTFHVIAITCVIWSLYVLIDRTTEEIARGELEWPFWTKLIVVAIGFTGGVVFMYVQCKMYIQLCRRWKTYNRVIFIQTCQKDTPVQAPPPPTLALFITVTGGSNEVLSETFHTPIASPDVSVPLLSNSLPLGDSVYFNKDENDEEPSVTISIQSPHTAENLSSQAASNFDPHPV